MIIPLNKVLSAIDAIKAKTAKEIAICRDKGGNFYTVDREDIDDLRDGLTSHLIVNADGIKIVNN